jgi:hypothetical protein
MTDNPGRLVRESVDYCLDLATTWIAWDGRPIARGENVWGPNKAVRRIVDHLIDHLAEAEALLAGADTIPDTRHGRMVTVEADLARFTEADLNETRNVLVRLGQLWELRLGALDPAEWDAPRGEHMTLRRMAEHLRGVRWYADQVGRLPMLPETEEAGD